ncbi:MAG: alkaline phosphatase family protein [Acidobacteriales bacterium]|nr:alkaline phosphatase family protein [Terriglobales bacterium]
MNLRRPSRYPVLVSLWLLWLAVLAPAQTPVRKIRDLKPTLLLVSIDGFRADYLDRGITPNLSRLAKSGVRAKWMTPAFPSKTFPNHYTIVTGLYPEHHGIVGNDVWDPDFQAKFTYNKPMAIESRWWWGEPIWNTAERQGMKAGSMFWPGSDAEIGGLRPSEWRTYEHKMPPEDRVAVILSWLDKPVKDRPRMLTLYFSDVDSAGHDYGPDSPELTAAVWKIDRMIGLLQAGFRQRGIEGQVNVIVVSDHGMIPTPADQKIFLEDIVDPASLRVVTWGQLLSVEALDGNNEALYQKLRRIPHATAYRKGEMPARFHYSEGRRIPPVLVLADGGWEITTRKRLADRTMVEVASHGYDNELPQMRALFVAAGPAFRPGRTIPGFPNVDVYPLLCRILGLEPAKNDGSLAPFLPVLKK